MFWPMYLFYLVCMYFKLHLYWQFNSLSWCEVGKIFEARYSNISNINPVWYFCQGRGLQGKFDPITHKGVRCQGLSPPNPSPNVKLAHLHLRSPGTEWVIRWARHGEGRGGQGRGLQGKFDLITLKGGPLPGGNPPKSKSECQTGTFAPPYIRNWMGYQEGRWWGGSRGSWSRVARWVWPDNP